MKKDNGHLMIMLGIGKKRGSGLSGPPPMPKSAATPQSAPDDELPGAPEGEPDADDAHVSGVDWDEALDFHDGTVENCGNCQYLQEDGSCPVVKHPVNPPDWCSAFTAKQSEQNSDQDMGENYPHQVGRQG